MPRSLSLSGLVGMTRIDSVRAGAPFNCNVVKSGHQLLSFPLRVSWPVIIKMDAVTILDRSSKRGPQALLADGGHCQADKSCLWASVCLQSELLSSGEPSLWHLLL